MLAFLGRRLAFDGLRDGLMRAAARRHLALAPGTFTWLFWASALAGTLGLGLYGATGDQQVGFALLNDFARPAPDWVLANLTEFGNTAVLVAIAVLAARAQPQFFSALVIAVLAGAVVINRLKDFFAVARPPAVLDPASFRLVGEALQHGSFPSGHTFATFTVAALAIGFIPHRLGRTALLLLATLIALGRVWVGAHWPLDLIGGAVGGMMTGALALAVSRHWRGGFHPAWHLATIALAVISNLVLLRGGSNYLLADPLMRTIALLSTLGVAWQYLGPGRRVPGAG